MHSKNPPFLSCNQHHYEDLKVGTKLIFSYKEVEEIKQIAQAPSK